MEKGTYGLAAGAVTYMALFAMGCATTRALPADYRETSQVLVDLLEKTSSEATKKIEVPSKRTVAIINLDGQDSESAHPSSVVYDMLSIGLTAQGVKVAERDREALYASIIESWSKRLPFYISPRCGNACSSSNDDSQTVVQKKVTTEVAQCDCNGQKGGGCCGGLGQIKSITTEENKIDLQAGDDGQRVREKDPREFNSYREMLNNGLRNYFDTNGKNIISKQDAADYVLGYRILYYGSAIEDTEDENEVRRVARVDIILRLIRTDDGMAVWSNRFKKFEYEVFHRDLKGELDKDRYTYHRPQLGAGEAESNDLLDALPGF
tara:strand:+ start:925 stop:1890 length:966 start_codon:yes stop_codon:yes gene_type:complete